MRDLKSDKNAQHEVQLPLNYLIQFEIANLVPQIRIFVYRYFVDLVVSWFVEICKFFKLFFIFLQFDCFLCKQVLKCDWLLCLGKASLLAGKICDLKHRNQLHQ